MSSRSDDAADRPQSTQPTTLRNPKGRLAFCSALLCVARRPRRLSPPPLSLTRTKIQTAGLMQVLGLLPGMQRIPAEKKSRSDPGTDEFRLPDAGNHRATIIATVSGSGVASPQMQCLVIAQELPPSGTPTLEEVKGAVPVKELSPKTKILFYCRNLFVHDGGYAANKNERWIRWLPEFDRPLAPPSGPATKTRIRYTRNFQHASVSVDLRIRSAVDRWLTAESNK